MPQRKTAMTSSEDRHEIRLIRYPLSSSTSLEQRKYTNFLATFNVINDDEHLAKIISTPPIPTFKQPSHLKQTIVHSKLPSLQDNIDHNTTQPCQSNLCKTCQIIDMDTTITRGNTTHHVHGRYSCDSANVVYLIRCRQGCPEAWYISETMQMLRQRKNGHCANIRQTGMFPPI
eukprot:g39183.t1